MDKAIYQAPQGIAEIENDALIELDDIEVEGAESEAEEAGVSVDVPHDANLVEYLDEAKVGSIKADLLVDIENDKLARKEWEETLTEGLALLGMRYQDVTEPWEGACGVYHPLIGEATVRFQSETVMETFPASGPVKTQIVGAETPEKIEAAKRVKEDMNFTLTEVMPEYRNEHERMLFTLAPMGCAFKKVYYDPNRGRPVSSFVPPEDVILPYGASHLPSAPRITHRMRKTKNDLLKLMESGFYAELDLTAPAQREIDEIKEAKDAEVGVTEPAERELYTIYEVSVDLALEEEEDEIARPYIFTILYDTEQVLAIRRNWLADDQLKLPRQHFVKYDYVPGFGPYGFGLIHLVGGFAKAGTTILRQLVDAGTWANMQGGFKTRGTRINNEDEKMSPGTFLDIDIPGTDIRQHVMQVETKEPSVVLAGLLEKIIEDGRRFAATADLDVSDMSAQAPVGTTMALLERMLKVMSAVQARVHYSFKQELKLLAGIIRDYAPDEYAYDPESGDRSARKQDYEMVEIIPVSDPNASTMSQRIVMWQAVMQLAAAAPNIYDQRELHRRVLEVFGVNDVAKLVPMPPELQPMDPITEGMRVLNGQPVKAFLPQDHNSHLLVHNNLLNDPMIQMQIGQNPNAQAIMGALMSHIAEHLAFQYRQQIEQNLGVPLPPPDQPMDPAMEAKIAPLVAEASKMLLAQSQIAAAQAEAQATGGDVSGAVEMEKIKVKREEIAHKKEDSLRDYEIAKGKLALEHKRLGIDAKLDITKIGVDVAKTAAQFKHQERQSQESNKFAARKGLMDHLSKSEQQDRQLAAGERNAERQAAQRAEEAKRKQAEQKKAKAAKPKKADQ